MIVAHTKVPKVLDHSRTALYTYIQVSTGPSQQSWRNRYSLGQNSVFYPLSAVSVVPGHSSVFLQLYF